MTDIFKWVTGRQGTGYMKMKLLELGNQRWGGLDAYLLRYEAGDSIPAHTDPIPGKRHYRLNLELQRATAGGQAYHRRENGNSPIGRITFFRSDIVKHGVTSILEGKRLVLSIGFAL